jgi:hypothetical protein
MSQCLNERVNQEGWNMWCPWTYRIIGEIRWWNQTIKTNHPRSLTKPIPPQVVITTDAAPEA